MKLGIFTTKKDPERRGDNYRDAVDCYRELADVVTIVDAYDTWPTEFNWPIIGEHFQKGYELTDADWVIHCDLDFIFHERDFDGIRQACLDNNDKPAMSFWKYQFILPDRYNLKSRLVIAVNKGKFGDRIKFNAGGDLCQPSLDGKELSPDEVPEANIPFYNYEKMTKNINQVKDDCGRMERAYHRHFGKYQMGIDGTDDNSYQGWLLMVKGRFNKPQKHIALKEHPKYVQETIFNLTPDQFGYDGFGEIGANDYVEA